MTVKEKSTAARVRLTDVSIADIGVANVAKIHKVTGGYKVEVSNNYGSVYLKDGKGEAVYKYKDSARRVVEKHNDNVKFIDDPVLPSPSMRPPEK